MMETSFFFLSPGYENITECLATEVETIGARGCIVDGFIGTGVYLVVGERDVIF